jgi:hypothetical protein
VSSTPPDQSGSSQGPSWSGYRGISSGAIMPIPGNAELALYIIALIVAIIVTAAADSVTMAFWFDFFKWTTAAYLLSRGIAKASRVLEQ